MDTLRNEDDIVLGAAISPDGRWLVVPAVVEAEDGVSGRLQVWDLSTRTLDRVVESPAGGLTSAFFSADGERLVTQGGIRSDGPPALQAVVWDTSTWEPVGEPWQLSDDYPSDRVIALSPDGERLASLSSDGAVRVWTVDDRQPLGEPPSAFDEIGFATADRVLARRHRSPSPATSAVRSWSSTRSPAPSSRPCASPTASPPPSSSTTPAPCWRSPTATAGRSSSMSTTRLELGPPLAASSSGINDVTFSADDSQLATGGTDRTGALWRLDGGRTIATAVSGHEASVTELAYTSDGRVPREQRASTASSSSATSTRAPPDRSTSAARSSPPPSIRADRWVAAGGTGRRASSSTSAPANRARRSTSARWSSTRSRSTRPRATSPPPSRT